MTAPPPSAPEALPNGPGAAAILAAGVGSLALGACAFAGDASPLVRKGFSLWIPTGPLSGVTLAAIVVWLAVWFWLSRRWARRDVNLMRVNASSFMMLIAGLLLTFPPFMDLLLGK
ncbi:MAG: hypothetical protein P4L73_07655 [Caulobacteraceae bacterium]|nr:hypothetical protein [Caulobacteraceae bacterium]